jgi:hypothetical protein
VDELELPAAIATDTTTKLITTVIRYLVNIVFSPGITIVGAHPLANTI